MIYFIFIFLVLFPSFAFANRSPLNIVLPFDFFLTSYEKNTDKNVLSFLYAEYGVTNSHAYNDGGNKVNSAQLWNEQENVIFMLDGSPNAALRELRNEIGDITDNNTGRVSVNVACKEDYSVVFSLQGQLKSNFYCALYVPYMHYTLDDIVITDHTIGDTTEALLVKNEITDNIVVNLKKFGNLNLVPWKRHGFGDLTLEGSWRQSFLQPQRPILKEVFANLHVGLTVPTGKKNDPDTVLAFAFGNGTVSIPFGGRLDVRFGPYCHLGMDILLIHTFSHVQEKRIKSSDNQTELFLLNKAEVYVNFGLTQRFILYGTLQNLIPYCSLMVGYDYLKQGEDSVTVRGNQFQTAITQKSQMFDERTMHHWIGKVSYNQEFSYVGISAALIARVPFKGKRVIMDSTIGLSLTVMF